MQSLPGDVLAGISDLNKGPSDKNGLEGERDRRREGGGPDYSFSNYTSLLLPK